MIEMHLKARVIAQGLNGYRGRNQGLYLGLYVRCWGFLLSVGGMI